MKIKKLALVTIASGIMACIAATNAFAEPLVINISDASFYEALKDCVQNHSMTNDELNALGQDEALNTVACLDMDDAIFDDDAMTITFEDGDAFKNNYNRGIILPNSDITSVNDAFKFSYYNVSDLSTAYFTYMVLVNGNIEQVGDMSREDVIIALQSIFLFGNKIEDIDFDTNRNAVESLVTEMCEAGNLRCTYGPAIEAMEEEFYYLPRVFETNYVNQKLEKEYSGERFELPQTMKSYVKYLNFMSSVYLDAIELSLQNEEMAAGMSADTIAREREKGEKLRNYYDLSKWLVLENATLSDDGEYLIPIDPTKDMSMTLRSSWEEIDEFDESIDGYYGSVAYPKQIQTVYEGDEVYHTLASIKVNYVAPNPNTSDEAVKFILAPAIIAPVSLVAYLGVTRRRK